MWYVTCPFCGFYGSCKKDFEMNMFDECFCPKCEECFEINFDIYDDRDEEEGDDDGEE